MLRFKVMSQRAAEDFTHEFHDEPFYILSIRGWRWSEEPCFDMTNKMIKDILYMQFEDIEDSHSAGSINEDDAARILDWARALPDDSLVVVHCRAGVSRSAATAAALSLLINGDDEEFWHFPPYVPNRLVYSQILECDARDKIYDFTQEKVMRNAQEYFQAYNS